MRHSMRLPRRIHAAALLGSAIFLALLVSAHGAATATRTVHVSGTGTDELNHALVHSKQTTPTGTLERSTQTVQLNGDLDGRVLYQVSTVVDSRTNTLVNTGDQVFSGTVAGSQPVMLHDSRFRFEVNLASGEERGLVYLHDHIAGPYVECTLKVSGTGKNQEGNPTFTYSGDCTFRSE